MSEAKLTPVNVLKLSMHNYLLGYITGFSNGKNVFSFAEEFQRNSARPTLSLITHPAFPRSASLMAEPWVSHHKLPPTFSNLLPEGALRELLARALKIHTDNEFHLLSYLGRDLPGALVVESMEPDAVPQHLLANIGAVQAVKFVQTAVANKFSLAGVQMKFSMKHKEGRYNFTPDGELGDWIIKTPSTQHSDVPLNEYSAMRLAEMVGVTIPEIRLVELDQLDNLPPIKLPDENLAFAIKRFDRVDGKRIHMEDFAQVLAKYPHEKYSGGNYQQLGRIIYQYSAKGLVDAQQFARRLLVNILLANGDAHLKNWSLLYPDQVSATLSPAYDIVTTSVYIENEQQFALNLAKTKAWYGVSMASFQQWAQKADIPWRAIKPHLDDVMDKARSLWPTVLAELPMNEQHKVHLLKHWAMLHQDFRV